MKKIAVFPGSFDPITIGHEAIIRRGLAIFDEIIVAIGANSSKKNFFSLETRKDMITKVFLDEPRVKIDSYEGLTVDYCKSKGISFILRGLRTSADFEFERAIGQINKAMSPGVDTVFLLAASEHSAITSTIIRDILCNGGDASMFVPKSIDLGSYVWNEA
jgi:pantetheine-phosphate adenylyltransferase